MQNNIAIIFGGEGAERHVSEKSAAAIIRSAPSNISLIKVGIDEAGEWFIFNGNEEDIERSVWREREDRLTPTYPVRLGGASGLYTKDGVIPISTAFPVLHGDMGEDGIIQGALACAHIPYIGSGVTPCAISADKAYTKIIAEYLSIPTAPWLIPKGSARSARREAEARLGYPMFIKPRRLGSSIGASAVNNPREFLEAYDEAYALSSGLVMIEAKISVERELEFALYDSGERFISPAGAINSCGDIYTYEKKYGSAASPKTEIDPKLDRATVRRARAYARRLCDYIGLGNISRIDFFLTLGGELIFNEINSIPGMTETSLYPALVSRVIGQDKFPAELLLCAKQQ